MNPSYLSNLKRLLEIAEKAYTLLKNCKLCPNDCEVNRISGKVGLCRSDSRVMVSSYNLHFGEEPPISGIKGSGTVFFTNCTLKCMFCQNYPISHFGHGDIISEEKLAGIFLELQRKSAHNINLVTPTHFLPQILKALYISASKGLSLPIVYNTSGYEKSEIIEMLDGIVDIYLPDAKYSSNEMASRFSGPDNYVENNRKSLKEMFRQVGILKLDSSGAAKKGILIRHLILPGGFAGTVELLKFLKEEISLDVNLGLMAQYFPAHKAVGHPELGHRLYRDDYKEIVDKAVKMGFKNLLIQHI